MHLVFDGRLLHGAPAHHALRPLVTERKNDTEKHKVRVTFLVNIWLSGRPSGVKPLPPDIWQHVRESREDSRVRELTSDHLNFDKRCVENIYIVDEKQLNPKIRGRIELPFVSKGATWVEDEEEGGGLVLVTFPPPEHQADTITIRVKFDKGLQPYLDYENDSEEGETDSEQDTHDKVAPEYVWRGIWRYTWFHQWSPNVDIGNKFCMNEHVRRALQTNWEGADDEDCALTSSDPFDIVHHYEEYEEWRSSFENINQA